MSSVLCNMPLAAILRARWIFLVTCQLFNILLNIVIQVNWFRHNFMLLGSELCQVDSVKRRQRLVCAYDSVLCLEYGGGGAWSSFWLHLTFLDDRYWVRICYFIYTFGVVISLRAWGTGWAVWNSQALNRKLLDCDPKVVESISLLIRVETFVLMKLCDFKWGILKTCFVDLRVECLRKSVVEIRKYSVCYTFKNLFVFWEQILEQNVTNDIHVKRKAISSRVLCLWFCSSRVCRLIFMLTDSFTVVCSYGIP